VTDVRRHEELLRVGLDEQALIARRRRAPDREAPVAVVVVEHHQEAPLPAHEEGRRAVTQAFAGLRQRETDRPDARKGVAFSHVYRVSRPGG